MIFQGWLQGKLPPYFFQEDSYKDEQGNGLLVRFLGIFEDELDEEVITYIENYLDIFDPLTCDAKFLGHLAYQLGNPPNLFRDEDKYRKLLTYIPYINQIKGSKESYRILFRLLGYDEISFYEAFADGNYRDEGLKRDANVKRDEPTPWVTPYTIYVVTEEIPEEDMEIMLAIVDFLEPVNATLVEILIAESLDFTTDVTAETGEDSGSITVTASGGLPPYLYEIEEI